MTTDGRAFSAAIASEVNAEMARQGIRSARAFARLLGDSNHTSVNHKLSPHTATFVPMTTIDLARYSEALGVTPSELCRRAELAVGPDHA